MLVKPCGSVFACIRQASFSASGRPGYTAFLLHGLWTLKPGFLSSGRGVNVRMGMNQAAETPGADLGLLKPARVFGVLWRCATDMGTGPCRQDMTCLTSQENLENNLLPGFGALSRFQGRKNRSPNPKTAFPPPPSPARRGSPRPRLRTKRVPCGYPVVILWQVKDMLVNQGLRLLV